MQNTGTQQMPKGQYMAKCMTTVSASETIVRSSRKTLLLLGQPNAETTGQSLAVSVFIQQRSAAE